MRMTTKKGYDENSNEYIDSCNKIKQNSWRNENRNVCFNENLFSYLTNHSFHEFSKMIHRKSFIYPSINAFSNIPVKK